MLVRIPFYDSYGLGMILWTYHIGITTVSTFKSPTSERKNAAKKDFHIIALNYFGWINWEGMGGEKYLVWIVSEGMAEQHSS